MLTSNRTILVCVIVACFAVCHPAVSSAAGGYDDLVVLFNDFREYQEPPISDGLPGFSPAAVDERFSGLSAYQERLAKLNTDDWPIWQQADYHLVRAEMNAVYFHFRVLKPWTRDPGFYSMWSGDTGPSVNLFRYVGPLLEGELPLSGEDYTLYLAILREIPPLYESARGHLTAASGDLADLALVFSRDDGEIFDQIGERLQDHHPDLAEGARLAGQASRDYLEWLQKSKHTMTAPAGLGKDNYGWWQRNVQLMPWGWDEVDAMVEREYDRVITFLKLEEHRNRDLPPLEVADSYEEWDKRLRQALHYVVEFLHEEEIMTIPDWVDPSDYYDRGDGEEGEPEEDLGDFLLPENLTVDTRYRRREILPGETHEYVGHMLDFQRQERLTKSPIRSAERFYNMSSIRTEGWAVALEELLMQAGVLDERPRRGRIMEYLMNASHMSLAIPDLKMHANEITLAEGRRLCAEIMPRGWTDEDDRMVWFEMKSNIRNPGGFHSNVVLGKAYFMKLFRERAQELGEDFVIRDFVDEFLASGVIPMSLIRWEMTGNSDDITLVTEEL
jgi:hypothetical protein